MQKHILKHVKPLIDPMDLAMDLKEHALDTEDALLRACGMLTRACFGPAEEWQRIRNRITAMADRDGEAA